MTDTQQLQAVENVLIGGDLSKLTEKERLTYITEICGSLGLNPLTKPFQYIKLQGKLTLYATRSCADQLRKIHGVSIKIVDKEEVDGLYIVTARARDKNGREDEDTGAVSIGGLSRDARANMIAKAITKAKRRVTLSICGLGFIDETEADDIPGASPVMWEADTEIPKKEAYISPSQGKMPPLGIIPPETEEISESEDTGLLIEMRFFEDQNQEPIKFSSIIEFAEEYENQMKNILQNKETPARKRMTQAKEFEKINTDGLNSLPEGVMESLKKRRLAANKKLGAQK